MPKLLRLLVLLVLVIGVIFIGFVWLLDAKTPKRNRYVIPENYRGWLCVAYAVPGAAPLPKEEGFSLVTFDATGVVQTSDLGSPGEFKDEFWWRASDERKRLNLEAELGGGFTMADIRAPDRHTFMFWVSKNAKAEQPPYSPDAPITCGLNLPSP